MHAGYTANPKQAKHCGHSWRPSTPPSRHKSKLTNSIHIEHTPRTQPSTASTSQAHHQAHQAHIRHTSARRSRPDPYGARDPSSISSALSSTPPDTSSTPSLQSDTHGFTSQSNCNFFSSDYQTHETHHQTHESHSLAHRATIRHTINLQYAIKQFATNN